jgi:site-specific recombinase XerD
LRSWYLPYSKEDWAAFTALNLPYSINQTETSGPVKTVSDNNSHGITEVPPEGTKISAAPTPTSISYRHPHFYIRGITPAQRPTLKNIPGTYWNQRYENWVIPAHQVALETLRKSLQIISEDQYLHWEKLINQVNNPPACIMYNSPEYPNQLLLQLKGHQVDTDFMKHIDGRTFHADGRYWVIPNHPDTILRITEHYTALGTKVISRIKLQNLRKKEPTYAEIKKYLLDKSAENIRYATLPYLDTLISQQYSISTIREYYVKFSKFAADILPVKCHETDVTKVNEFLCKISESNASESLLNGYINAIKFYFDKVIFLPEFKIDRIKRPRKGHHLPKVLSAQQVDAMLRATQNLKHTALLYALYGHGIRLDEVLCLRLDDLLWDRNQIFINQGKGNKDRYVPMSQEFKTLIELYIHEYRPQYWLFEGQDQKSQYSDRSVQEVVRKAAKKAGINIKVTPHTMRHSFATHLVDVGTQLPYIKELLGHKDIKTTMIYTHVTTASIEKIVSPLDRLKRL